MLLKSLSLRGFKTFAESTEIEFGSGSRITAVVGPNGCGKSNVLDATRWVLGEDNPRHLRVSTLSDIIFAGTAAKKPLSLAEVTLIFDNSSGKLPVPYSEVAIKRRTFREGESEFFINKNLCRLKDIKDLLLDTGLGEGTYSIITQGQVDSILSSKGEERRMVFEEAAGINKYKTRKLSAERKLIAAEQNILRISDLKVEVGEQLITLEDQARRAQEYLVIQTRVKEIEIGLCKKILGGIMEKKVKLEAELVQARAVSEEKAAEEQKDEDSLLRLKDELRRLELALDEHLVKVDQEKDRLRDVELNRRFVTSELKRSESVVLGLDAKKTELLAKINELKTGQTSTDPALTGGAVAEILQSVIQQALLSFNLLSAIASFFGEANSLQLLGQKEIEAATNLKLELLEGELHRAEEEIERAQFGLQANRRELESLSPVNVPAGEANPLLEATASLRQKREALKQQIDQMEIKLRQEEKNERESGSNVTVVEIALAKLEGEILGLTEKISSEYNLSLDELAVAPYEISNIARSRQDVEEGKRRLRELEPVNLLAIDEFEKTRERASFIDAQLADLNGARENLRNLIIELDARAEESFIQTMQQLSAVFSETFAKLFAGGEAKIILSPDKPPLEADIDISVRPAGRRWLSLSLLSGGERSLSAIAILFSLLKIRPSPFCFLDEVDAALDEANIGRFNEMLRDFSSTSQMIVITHNKRTMSVADNIYGITMEEPGVSKVVSMKLTEAAA